jgi:hypothetical protein
VSVTVSTSLRKKINGSEHTVWSHEILCSKIYRTVTSSRLPSTLSLEGSPWLYESPYYLEKNAMETERVYCVAEIVLNQLFRYVVLILK